MIGSAAWKVPTVHCDRPQNWCTQKSSHFDSGNKTKQATQSKDLRNKVESFNLPKGVSKLSRFSSAKAVSLSPRFQISGSVPVHCRANVFKVQGQMINWVQRHLMFKSILPSRRKTHGHFSIQRRMVRTCDASERPFEFQWYTTALGLGPRKVSGKQIPL